MAELPKPIRPLPIEFTQIFINNEFVNSVSGKTFSTFNPATEEKIADIQEGDKADVDKAVAAAKAAFKKNSAWRQLDASARGTLLNKLADLIERDKTKLASLETLDNGMPFLLAYHANLSMSVNILRYNAGIADKIVGQTIPANGTNFCFTRHEPVGVVGAITPVTSAHDGFSTIGSAAYAEFKSSYLCDFLAPYVNLYGLTALALNWFCK